MTGSVTEQPKVTDLRGSVATPRGSTVLADPTGRRGRRLRLLARLMAVALTLWLVTLVLGGVGLGPVPGIPFAHVFRAPPSPPKIEQSLKPRQPSAADRRPARPVAAGVGVAPVAVQRRNAAARTVKPTTPNGPTTKAIPRHTQAVRIPTTPVVAPTATPAPHSTHTTTTHTNNGKHTGSQTTTTDTTTTTTTAPGNSGNAPGRTETAPGRMRVDSTPPTP